MKSKRSRKRKAMPARRVEAMEWANTPRPRARYLRSWRLRAFVAILMLLAVALRVANLTAQSLWADEGNSVRVTERPLDLVVAAARADIHPPGYYLLLWSWVKLFGQGEVAVRALSVAIGVALVGLVYLIGKQWFGPRAGWLAAFCAAVAPLQVAYSQEVRMYILVAFLGAGVTYAWGQWIAANGRRQRLIWSIVYALAASAGLWTHYSFPAILAAINVAWLAWWLRARPVTNGRRPTQTPHADVVGPTFRVGADLGAASALVEPNVRERWKALGGWLGTHLCVLLLYSPWLPTAWDKILHYGPISEGHSISTIVAQALKLLSVGESVPDDDFTRWLTVAMVGLAVFGAWNGFATRGPSRRWLSWVYTFALVLLVVAPVAMMAVLALTGRPAYRPKFFLVASPAFCLLVGQGVALLESTPGQRRTMSSQFWLLMGMGIVGLSAARSLRNYYFNPAYARADYRSIAGFIAQVEREGDAILLNAPNQWEVFTYYYRGQAAVYPLCRTRPPHEEKVIAELTGIAARHPRLFALYWAVEESDPERIVERWLEANAFKAADAWYGDVRLVTYAMPETLDTVEMTYPPGIGMPDYPLEDVRLGEAIALRGYSLAPDAVQRGDILQVTLFWEALDVPSARYKVFLHLEDASGQIVSQYDSEPGHGMNLTINWRPGQGVFPDRYGVLVPGTLASGTYQLLMGMYEVSGAPRLLISIDGEPAGDVLTLATIKVR